MEHNNTLHPTWNFAQALDYLPTDIEELKL